MNISQSKNFSTPWTTRELQMELPSITASTSFVTTDKTQKMMKIMKRKRSITNLVTVIRASS